MFRRVLLCLLILPGCFAPRRPPPMKTVKLAGWRASYRAYGSGGAGICDAEQRWLIDELSSVNGMLGSFLERAEESRPTDPALQRLLSEATEVLPTVLDEHARNLERLRSCGFASRGGFPALAQRGTKLVADIRALLENAPAELAYAKAVAALEAFRRDLPKMELDARRTCPNDRSTELYFASEGEDGTRTWRFCDGARVLGRPGEPMAVLEPPNMTRAQRRRFKESTYLDAANAFPRARLVSPPSVPPPPDTADKR